MGFWVIEEGSLSNFIEIFNKIIIDGNNVYNIAFGIINEW